MSTNNVMWKPTACEKTQMYTFMQRVNKQYQKTIETYSELHQWSVDYPKLFWEMVWQENQVVFSKNYESVVDDEKKMPGANWFEGAQLNFAENLLRFSDDHTAIMFKGEIQDIQTYSYKELRDAVAKVAFQLRQLGVSVGDCVAGIVANTPEAVIAMLATTSIGAVWSSCSPDFGVEGILSRFTQIKPKVLFSVDGYWYKNNVINATQKACDVINVIESIESVVLISYVNQGQLEDISIPCIGMSDVLNDPEVPALHFEQLPFNHPIYILYSSGTTGIPKCIVHGAGGVLLQHLKELKLHTDLRRDDKLFYFTTCGWMMWNWMVSGLAVGATVVLFDGNPFYPSVNALWELVDTAGITVFGTSAKYLAASEKFNAKPKEQFKLETLRAILSTGSPLTEDSFDYVYRDIKSEVMLSSISGGTDIVSCFVLGNPLLPVIKGEIQCRGLGMDVHALDESGTTVLNQKGELVCRTSFPNMPIYFWNDQNNEKYHQAYFDTYPNIWCHGDYITVYEHGGVKIWGRSDATLNPGGVRIGTAEIYRVVETLSEVMDSIVVGQQLEGDEKVILFVKMKEDHSLDPQLKKKIRNLIKKECTSRHVPSVIIEVPDIPYTMSGKKVEVAVKKVIHGEAIKNKDAIQNPEVLDYFKSALTG